MISVAQNMNPVDLWLLPVLFCKKCTSLHVSVFHNVSHFFSFSYTDKDFFHPCMGWKYWLLFSELIVFNFANKCTISTFFHNEKALFLSVFIDFSHVCWCSSVPTSLQNYHESNHCCNSIQYYCPVDAIFSICYSLLNIDTVVSKQGQLPTHSKDLQKMRPEHWQCHPDFLF